jgi:glyoxylase-like metal-dependent hydrolase (beta-lactamase superfamily II)
VSIEEVQPRIYRVPSVLGRRRFAQWLVVGDERLLLVDSGVDGTIAEHVTPALAELGRTPADITDVVISHADVDHYGGNAELRALAPDARLRAHPLDRPLIESWEAIAARRYGWYRGHGLDYPTEAWAWLRDAAGPDTPLDGDVHDGETIDLGGLSLEVLHLPGHSAGHIGLWERASGTAIVLDAVMGRGFTTVDGARGGPPPYGDVAAYRGSVERLRALAPARLATAHFPLLEGPAVADFLDATVAFADELERALLELLGSTPLPLAALLEPCDAAVGPFPEMPVELARSIGAQLEQLAADGRIVRVRAPGGERWARA